MSNLVLKILLFLIFISFSSSALTIQPNQPIKTADRLFVDDITNSIPNQYIKWMKLMAGVNYVDLRSGYTYKQSLNNATPPPIDGVFECLN
jgi:hypothetical protein